MTETWIFLGLVATLGVLGVWCGVRLAAKADDWVTRRRTRRSHEDP